MIRKLLKITEMIIEAFSKTNFQKERWATQVSFEKFKKA